MRRSSNPISGSAPQRGWPRGRSRMVEPLLSVRGLFAGYGDVDVLRGIDLDVASGEIVAVLGSNGVGKTTLNKTLSGVLSTSAGEIDFEGRSLRGLSAAAVVEM